MKFWTPALGLVLLSCAAGVSAKGDVESGKQLAYTCTGCHGITGYKNAYPFYHVPRIAGQNYTYLLNALKSYQAGERLHPTMQAQAESFSDQDLDDLATFLAQAKGKGE